MKEFRPIPGFEGLYELDREGRCFSVERDILQDDDLGRKFIKHRKRLQKTLTFNGSHYPAYNLHKNNRQTCRVLSKLMRETWGIKWDPRQVPEWLKNKDDK